jgi:hypothetical protein
VAARPPDHQLPRRHGHNVQCRSRFATVCDGLRIGCRRSRTVTRVQARPARDHGRQSTCRPAGRDIGSRTIAERPGSSQFECGGQYADSGLAGRESLRIAACYVLRWVANRRRLIPTRSANRAICRRRRYGADRHLCRIVRRTFWLYRHKR